MPERLSEAGLRRLRERVVTELGGYLRNVVREQGVTCVVCAGPVAAPFVECFRCRTDRLTFGDQLADLVVPISYAIKGGQSGHLMWMYKSPTTPVARYQTLLTLLLLVTLALHERCVAGTAGRPVDAWATVPSTNKREGEHPLHVVARRVRFPYPEIRLSASSLPATGDRSTAADRFTADDPELAAGKHVLVIDDTWATGARSQSAAVALKQAGASVVTILVIARWLKPHEHQPSADFERGRLSRDFDPHVCPVSGEPC